jgi:hypothetical protein
MMVGATLRERARALSHKMAYFDQADLRAVDSLVRDIEREARDDGELVRRACQDCA